MSYMGTDLIAVTPAALTLGVLRLSDRDILGTFADRKITENQELLDLGKLSILDSTKNQGIISADVDRGLERLTDQPVALGLFQGL